MKVANLLKYKIFLGSRAMAVVRIRHG